MNEYAKQRINIGNKCILFYFFFLFLFSSKDMLIGFRKRGREGKREGEREKERNIDWLPLLCALTRDGT